MSLPECSEGSKGSEREEEDNKDNEDREPRWRGLLRGNGLLLLSPSSISVLLESPG